LSSGSINSTYGLTLSKFTTTDTVHHSSSDIVNTQLSDHVELNDGVYIKLPLETVQFHFVHPDAVAVNGSDPHAPSLACDNCFQFTVFPLTKSTVNHVAVTGELIHSYVYPVFVVTHAPFITENIHVITCALLQYIELANCHSTPFHLYINHDCPQPSSDTFIVNVQVLHSYHDR
jgi:hypothetical protein